MIKCKVLPNSWMAQVASLALFSLFILALHQSTIVLVQAAYPPNLFNNTGCLYAYMSDSGHYEVTFIDNTDDQKGYLSKPTYESKSSCIDPQSHTGLLALSFEMSGDNNFASINIDLQLKALPKEYSWEINKATLRAIPNNKNIFPSTPIELKSASGDIYAGHTQSYSCSSLVLVNKQPVGQNGAQIRITLKRFQVQPFYEPSQGVFAPSRDCSTWLTLPQIMGFLLVLFMIFTVLIGVYLLLELGEHSSDLRFSKQGGMLMNQAQLDATKAD